MSEIEPRELWIDFFLRCAHEVDSTFKRGTPKMTYVPIQTSNGRRNPISLWQEPEAVKIDFVIERNSDFEARIKSLGLPCHYDESVKHLQTAVAVSPNSNEGVLFDEIAKVAFHRALTAPRISRRKTKDRFNNTNTVEMTR